MGPEWGEDRLRVFQMLRRVGEWKQLMGDVWTSKIAASMYFWKPHSIKPVNGYVNDGVGYAGIVR